MRTPQRLAAKARSTSGTRWPRRGDNIQRNRKYLGLMRRENQYLLTLRFPPVYLGVIFKIQFVE